jgi:hypothetical protein
MAISFPSLFCSVAYYFYTVELDLSDNEFTGTIPATIGSLPNLSKYNKSLKVI